MKIKDRSAFAFLAFAAAVVLSFGCNQAVDNGAVSQSAEVAEAVESNVTETSGAAETSAGCCGKCAAEAGTIAKAGGCCGKCAEKELTESAEAAESGCQTGCNACAQGDAANCECEAATAKPAEEDSAGRNADVRNDEAVSHVNSMPEDRDVFHFLLKNHDKITRTVKELDNGVETVTESTDAAVAVKIQEHVASMHRRIEDGRPLRMWDELYREIFKHADKIKMEIRNTEHGIAVTETSDDEYVVKLIQAHAKVVTGFSQRGFEEARQNHQPPTK